MIRSQQFLVRIGRLLWIFGYGSKFWLHFPIIPNFSTGKAFSRSKTPIKKVSRDFDRARARANFLKFLKNFQKIFSLQNRKTNASWRFLRAPWTSYDALHNFTARSRNSARVFNFFRARTKKFNARFKIFKGRIRISKLAQKLLGPRLEAPDPPETRCFVSTCHFWVST